MTGPDKGLETTQETAQEIGISIVTLPSSIF